MANLKLNKLETTVEVVLTEQGADWTKHIEKAKKILMDNLEIKGFRKGKVPANIAEQKISEGQIWNEAANSLLEVHYSEAMDLLMKEKIATRPTLKIEAVSNEEVKAILTSVLMPEVKIGDRSSIKVEYKVEEVTQEDIDAEVKQLDTILQKQEEAGPDAVAKDGDMTNIDFLGKVDGVAFEGGEAKGFDLTLGSKQFIDGFEEQVVGMKIGEEKDIEVTFPETYPEESLKGKPAVFTVKLNAVKKMVNLEGEELVEKLKTFGFDNKDEVVARIKEVATDRKVQMANDEYFRNYMDAILALEDTKVTLPEEIIEQEIEQEFKRFEAQIAQQGLTMDKYMEMLGMNEEEFKSKNLREASEKRVKDGLIYSQLIEELEIKVEEADLEAEYAKIAKDSKAKVEDVKKQVAPQSIESNVIFKKLVNTLKG